MDLAQQLSNIKGIVAISPSYQEGFSTKMITCPVVLVIANNDRKEMKKYLSKWKRYIMNLTEINHAKGHKVYLPLETMDLIKIKMEL